MAIGDRLEQTVRNERAQAELDAEIPLEADIDHPALRPHYDKMVKKYQKQMSALDVQRRELDRQTQQLAMLQATMQQQPSAAGTRETNAETDEYDWLDPEVKPLLSDPSAAPLRALVRSIGKRTGNREPDPQVNQMSQTVKALQERLDRAEGQLVQERYTRQIPDFKRKWGDALDDDSQRSILEYAVRNNVDLEHALFAVNPATALEVERKRVRDEAFKEAAAEYGAQLEGMNDIVASRPQTNRSPVTKDGRLVSMRETGLDVLGKGGMINAIRNGFNRDSGAPVEGE
jgi:hypothetical protein